MNIGKQAKQRRHNNIVRVFKRVLSETASSCQRWSAYAPAWHQAFGMSVPQLVVALKRKSNAELATYYWKSGIAKDIHNGFTPNGYFYDTKLRMIGLVRKVPYTTLQACEEHYQAILKRTPNL